ncbi:MAG: hypothetical protein LBR61_08630 [Synergistaceae bacterium]|jgi:hypothetical protein|nr:hypothetical protein [Synergistaceae bacterium]
MTNQGLFDEDISDLRVRLYEETKNMTPDELNEHIDRQVRLMFENHGMQPHFEAKKQQKFAV